MKSTIRLLQSLVVLMAMSQQVSWAQSQQGPSESDRTAFKAAFDKCAEKYGKPNRGEKPSDEFEACMTAAGFKRPSGPPPGERGAQHGAAHDVSSGSSQQ